MFAREENLRVIVRQFAELCRRRRLKVNAGNGTNGEERLKCEVHVDGIRLEHVSEFKYLGCVLSNQTQMGQNAIGRWRAGGL